MRNLAVQHELRRSCGSITDLADVYNFRDGSAVLLSESGTITKVSEMDQVDWTCNLNDTVQATAWFNVRYVDPHLVCFARSGAIVTVHPGEGEAELAGEFENGIEAASWSPDMEVLLLLTFSEDDHSSVLVAMNVAWEVLAEMSLPNHNNGSASICWRPDGTLAAVSSVDEADNDRKIRIYKRENLEFHAIGRSEDGSGKLVPNLQSTPVSWAGQGCSQVLAAVQSKGKKKQVVFFEPNGLRHRDFVLRETSPDFEVLGLDWSLDSDLLCVSLRTTDCEKVQLWHRSNYHWYLKREIRYSGSKLQHAFFERHGVNALVLNVLLESAGDWRQYTFRWDSSTIAPIGSKLAAFVIDGSFLNYTLVESALLPPPMYGNTVNLEEPIHALLPTYHKLISTCAAVILSSGKFVLLEDTQHGTPQLKEITWDSELPLDFLALSSLCVVESTKASCRIIGVRPRCNGDDGDNVVELVVDIEQGKAHALNTIPLKFHVLAVSNWADSKDGAILESNEGELYEFLVNVGQGEIVPADADPLPEPCPWIGAVKDAYLYQDDSKPISHKRLVIGLSSRRQLFCHDLHLADAVSSFSLAIEHEYLCFVAGSSRCELRFASIAELCNFDPFMGAEEYSILIGYEPRAVERGSRLVTILPHEPRAILQMPRGNLEAVWPRALVVRHILHLLAYGNYKDSFDTMRRQRVDLNLIVDINPNRFVSKDGGANQLLDQISNPDHLNLFISCLQNWNSTENRYRIPRWVQKKLSESYDVTNFNFQNKVNTVCRTMREIMLERDKIEGLTSSPYLLPILSTFAKEDPPKLEEALQLIRERTSQIISTSRKPPLFSEFTQSAIQYLAFLADYEMLFNTALGMYDFELARAVARNSQMDPKVYLPMLKRYMELPTNYARFEVDIKLSRYESALEHLYRSRTTEEVVPANPLPYEFKRCLTLIEEHRLYKVGLQLFTSDEEQRQILIALGNFLLNDNQADTALTVFLECNPPDVEKALSAARSCKDWRTLFALECRELENGVSEHREARIGMLAHDVAEELVGMAKGAANSGALFMEAATLLLDYSDDVAKAVDLLVTGELWAEALRICRLKNRKDLEQKCIDSACAFADATIEELKERTEAFLEANNRYAVVLKMRKEAADSLDTELTGTVTPLDDSGSLFSAASTMSVQTQASSGSLSSVSTVISVKSTSTFTVTGAHESSRHKSKFNQAGKVKTRKPKKGKGRSKIVPGSHEELLGLVQTLKTNCIDNDFAMKVAETIQFLGRNGHMSLARLLYNAYCEMHGSISSSQQTRLQTADTERDTVELPSRLIPVEREVDALKPAQLPQNLKSMFSYL